MTEDANKKWANGHEPIAVIGLSCKFAGDAANPEKLWKMLAEGRDAWSEIPTSRFDPKGVYHPDAQKLSTVSSAKEEGNEKRGNQGKRVAVLTSDG